MTVTLRQILVPLGAAALIAGCVNEECLDNKSTLPKAGFYSYAEPSKQVGLDSMLVYAAGAPDTQDPAGERFNALLSPGDRATGIYMPFDQETDTTRFVFRYMQKDLAETGAADTVTCCYTRTPWFVNSACGVSYRYGVTSVEHTRMLIDSIAVPYGYITNVDRENFRIYFRIKDDTEPQ